MIVALAVKMLATAVVVIAVTLSVARLGPRLGGIIAGTPIVLGPAYFFMGREQSAAFVHSSAVSTLHALTATLLYLITYVAVAGRLGAVASVATAIAAWLVGAFVFSYVPGGVGWALIVYAALFLVATFVARLLRLPHPRVHTPTRWPDLLLRGTVAGILVGVATTVGARLGPQVSGTLTGFPVGFLVIALTLHQRFGAPVSRATLSTAQRGMFSLIAFAATTALMAPVVGGEGVFYLALASSVAVSALLFGLSRMQMWILERGEAPFSGEEHGK